MFVHKCVCVLQNTMVVGYDAYHEKGSRTGAYGAVVSTLNQSWSRYLSQAATHHNHEELSNNFALGVKSESGRFAAAWKCVDIHTGL